MKVFNTIVKITVALAAVAGAVYVAATYGDKIVAWCKKTLSALSDCKCCKCSNAADEADIAVVPEADFAPAADEAPVEEEVPAEAPAEEGAVVADENDFEG